MTSMPRLAAARSRRTLVDPQSTVTMTDARASRRLDRRDRQAVALVEPARHVRLDVQPEPAQRDDQDREAVQAVCVEVAEDHDPLAAVAGASRSGREARSASGSSAGRAARQWLGEPRDESSAGRRPHAARRPAMRSPSPRSRAASRSSGSTGPDSGSSSESAVRAPASGCHGRLHRAFTRDAIAGRHRDQDAARRGARRPRGLDPTVTAVLPQVPDDQQWARHEDRRIRPEMMPMSSARTKSLIADPPNR